MTLQDIGNLGEFIAAVATLATLVYLAIQIRQNTRTVRTSTYQAALESSNKVNELVMVNPDLHRIYRLGRIDPSQLTDEERARFRMLIGQLMNVYETMFLMSAGRLMKISGSLADGRFGSCSGSPVFALI